MYQSVGPAESAPAVPESGAMLRVTVVLEVPTDRPGLSRRAAELADEFGTMMTRLLPGVQAGKATISATDGGPAGVAQAPQQGLVVDVPRRLVTIDGGPVRLAYREFEMLKYLATGSGRVVPRTELMTTVWGDVSDQISERTVDTHVQRVRAKLENHGRSLVTVRGRGYRFDPSDDTRIIVTRNDFRAG